MNKKLLTRLAFLGLFGVAVMGIYLMAQNLSKSNQNNPGTVVDDSFLPSEPGKVVLVEFSDFQCPACAYFYPIVKRLKADMGDKLIVDYKYFPLKQIHRNADISSRAGEAARIQGKFWEMHDMLFEKQNDWASADDAMSIFSGYAVSLGLDKDKFAVDVELSSTYDKVSADYQQGVSLGVAGTPTFFVNGKKITNPGTYDAFKSIIEQSIK